MSLSAKDIKADTDVKKKVFHIILLALFINAVIVVFNFLFTLLGHLA